MKRLLIANLVAALAMLGACASNDAPQSTAAPFDPAACYARDFNVYFESWQYELSEEAQNDIATLQDALEGCAIDRVRIVGMAGAPGNEQANIVISQQRAETIAAALEAGGWPRDNFQLTAIGEAGASVGDLDVPMRRRVQISVEASAP